MTNWIAPVIVRSFKLDFALALELCPFRDSDSVTEWEILTPLARGIIGILRPEGVFCCPRAVGPRAAENTRRAENTNYPEGNGV